jgi:hypothetical protein
MSPEQPLARLLAATMGVAPLRFALAGAAVAAGAVVQHSQGIPLAFLLGTLATTVAVLADPRRQFFGEVPADPPPPSATAPREPFWRTALAATIPSSVGLAILAAVALAFNTVLAAFLAGGVCGLGVAGLISGARVAALERQLGGRLWFERGAGGRAFLER